MALPAPDTHDIDHLLAQYRTARTQQALFDVRGDHAGSGYDEFVDAAGNVRPAWQELAECVGERGRGGLDQLRSIVRGLVDNDGITYIRVDRRGDVVTNGDGTAEPGPWHLDALPLLISSQDWDTLESGLVQRSRLLDAVLTDLYGPRHSVTSGVLPPQLLFAYPGYVRAARGIEDERLALLQRDAAVLELADADLRALQVAHDRDRASNGARDFADQLGAIAVIVSSSVREIEAHDIDACAHHPLQHRGVARGGPERGDDLRAAKHWTKCNTAVRKNFRCALLSLEYAVLLRVRAKQWFARRVLLRSMVRHLRRRADRARAHRGAR